MHNPTPHFLLSSTRCIDLRPNQYYEFAAMMKLTDKSGSPALDTLIDPNAEWGLNKSPIMTLSAREYRDATTKKFIYTAEDRDKAWMARPYKPNDWNLVHGIFRLPENCARVFWEIEQAPEWIQFIVDSVSITPFACSPGMLVKNGGLEYDNTTTYWDTWGGGTGLEIVPGYGGSGNALKAFQRLHQSDGPAQEINIDCLQGMPRNFPHKSCQIYLTHVYHRDFFSSFQLVIDWNSRLVSNLRQMDPHLPAIQTPGIVARDVQTSSFIPTSKESKHMNALPGL